MENQTQELNQEKVPKKKKKKKGHAGLIIVILLFILAIGGAGAYYFTARQQPQKAVETFLSNMQNMNFEGMSAQLQSNDLSALDDADIRDAAYTEFFKGINQKLTYKISKNQFNIQNGTANITVRIKYIDGSDIYKETISEFLRQIVSTAFSGKELTEEETQQKLAAILQEKASTVEDKFMETDITYPVIKTNEGWKIVSLDDETVKIMSANFKNVQDEINNELAGIENEAAQETEQPAASEGDTIDLANEKFTIHYTKHTISKDFGGNPCLMVYYDYTNNGTAVSSAMVDVNLQAYQNGSALSAAIPENNEDAIDKFMAEIEPGQTVNVCQAFSLNDESDVTLQAGEAFSFGGGNTSSQILKVK